MVAVRPLADWGVVELALYDRLVRMRMSRQPVPSPVVLVEVDAAAAEELGWPFPRSWHARLVRLLDEAGARAVALDFMFVRPGPEDAELARAVERSGKVVLAVDFLRRPGGGPPQVRLPAPPLRQARLGAAWSQADALQRISWGFLHQDCQAPEDPRAHGGVRRLGSLAFETARLARGAGEAPVRYLAPSWRAWRDGVWTCGALTVAGDRDGRFLVDYRAPPDRLFARYRYTDVLSQEGGSFTDRASGRRVDSRQAFADKVVVVMGSFDANDAWAVPGLEERLPGGVVQAYMIDTLLGGTAPRWERWTLPWLQAFLAGLMLATAYRVRHPGRMLAAMAGLGGLFLAAAAAAFVLWRLWLPVAWPVLFLAGAAGLAMAAEAVWARGLLSRWESLADRMVRQGTLLGLRVGGYRLVEPLGEGGMAAVYRAVPADTLDDTGSVAIKVLHPRLSGDRQCRQRFRREIEISRTLSHPSLVRVLGGGEQEGCLYLVLELVRGESLRLRMRRGPLNVVQSLALLEPVARALDYAHSRGVVHRDVKPENILLGPQGPRLTDFGMAWAAGSETATAAGQVLGTAFYVAPEQIEGRAGPASDQYALGAVLYEMLAGRPPFAAETPLALLRQHLTEPPPPLERPDLPPGVEEALGRMLAKDPGARFPTVGAALEAVRRASGPATPG
jgi:CHASE2 domain-containing sensor protein